MSFENRYCHWKGKYTRIFSSLMETFLFVILLIFLQWAIQMVYKQVFSKQRSNFHWFYLIFSDVFSCSFEFSFFSLIGIIIINYKLPLFRRSVLINFALPNILTRHAIHIYADTYLDKTPVLGWFFNLFCSFLQSLVRMSCIYRQIF